jgi:hypothetical protein
MPVSVNPILCVQYSFEAIEQEARQLVEKGVVSRSQQIYSLCEYIPVREWICFERELEAHELLLRDRIGDLLSREEWQND